MGRGDCLSYIYAGEKKILLCMFTHKYLLYERLAKQNRAVVLLSVTGSYTGQTSVGKDPMTREQFEALTLNQYGTHYFRDVPDEVIDQFETVWDVHNLFNSLPEETQDQIDDGACFSWEEIMNIVHNVPLEDNDWKRKLYRKWFEKKGDIL